jgi:5-methylcytosine-specific restriction endonuclease McrA
VTDGKRCKKCSQTKPLSDFPRRLKRSADGYRPTCRKCTEKIPARSSDARRRERAACAARAGREYAPKAEHLATKRSRARRKRREKSAHLQLFHYSQGGELPDTVGGALLILRTLLTKHLGAQCAVEGLSVKSVTYQIRYRSSIEFRERERLRSSGKRWENRAAGRDDGTLTKDVVRRLFAKGRRCPYCAQPMRPRDKSLDHMEPLSRGGWHSATNVLVCCRRCNVRKNDTPFHTWLAKIPAVLAKAIETRQLENTP